MLNTIYNETNGSTYTLVSILDLGKNIGLKEAETLDIVQYLNDEYLISKMDLAGFISITHDGILQIENANSNPNAPSKYFPPVNVINNINIGGNSNAPILVGNTNSNQNISMSDSYNVDEISEWIKSLEEKIIQEKYDNEELNNQIETIKLLLKQKKTNMPIIKVCLTAIKDILVNVASNTVFQTLLAIFPK